MKKVLFALIGMLMLTGCGMTREIECDTVNDEGARVRITSANRLFSGCGLRVCEYTPKGKTAQYALELDIQDRVLHVSKGDLLTVHMYDGTKVVLKNMEDAESDVTTSVSEETEYVNTYEPYFGWYGALHAMPVSYSYTHPVVHQDSYIKLYYHISPEQMQTIMNGKVEDIVIATDRDPIEKTGRDMPDILRGLMALFD